MSHYSNREKEMMHRMAVNLHKKVSEITDNQAKENLDAKPDDMTNGKDAMCDNRANHVNEAMNQKKRTFPENQKVPKKEP